MEKSKEKTIKLSLSKAVILIIIGILIVIISVFIDLKIYKAKYNFDFKNFKNNYCKVSYDNKDYYILDGECTGEYDIQFIKYQNYKNLDYNDFMDKIKNINKCEIMTYNEYKN